MNDLVTAYKRLINDTLPATYTFPVRYNHCFARIILDWLFSDCWYHHLSPDKPAVAQLTKQQLMAAIERMNSWLHNQQLLISDNEASLKFRRNRMDKNTA